MSQPSPETVFAARAHLTERYARGVERLLWETEKHPLADLDAIRAVLDASSSGEAQALDVGAALVLLQAARLDLDRLEFEIFEAAVAVPMSSDAIAAVLDVSSEAATKRFAWLASRHAMRHAEVRSPDSASRPDPREAAERAGERARRASARAGEAAQRRQQVRTAGSRKAGSSHTDAARASARADEARMLADEAMDRLVLRLLRAAAIHERSAAIQQDLANADPGNAENQRQKAEDHYKAAAAYRRLVASWGADGAPQD